jgi:putative transposase
MRRGPAESWKEQGTFGRCYRLTLHQERRKRGPRAYEAGKKTKGRKQPIAVDTMGFILSVVVHSAGIQDRVGARAVLIRLFRQIHGLKKIFADGGYTSRLIDWTAVMFAAPREIVKRSDVGKFVVLPKRWIVERTFAWRTLSVTH